VRRMGCLSALFSLVLWAGVLVVLAWFAVAGYQHFSDYRAMADRTKLVADAWVADPATLAKAATGAVVRPADLPAQPFQQVGARPTQAYTSTGASLVLRTTLDTCAPYPLTVELAETPVLVQVLVHQSRPWLPPVSQWWDDVRDTTPCVPVAKATTIRATLGSPLGRRVVVDSVTGYSVKHG
jgi:hypothetical protein